MYHPSLVVKLDNQAEQCILSLEATRDVRQPMIRISGYLLFGISQFRRSITDQFTLFDQLIRAFVRAMNLEVPNTLWSEGWA